jgi:hypothetical protein
VIATAEVTVTRFVYAFILCVSIIACCAVLTRADPGPGAAVASDSQSSILLGAATIGGGVLSVPTRRVTASEFGAQHTGTVTELAFYVSARSRARRLIGGLYTSGPHAPKREVATTSKWSPHRGQWNVVKIPPTAIRAGRHYWLAALAFGGRLDVRDQRTQHGCQNREALQRGLSVLPASWQTRLPTRKACRFSAYALGSIVKSATPSPSQATTPPLPPPRNCAGARGSGVVSQSALDGCGFPSMDSTGPAAGTTFTNSSGFTASTAGHVYNGLDVSGSIYISASNVTIENSDITDVDPNSAAIQVAANVTGVQIINDSIHGTNAVQSGSLAFGVSYWGSSITGVTINDTNFYNGDRILVGYGTVTNSYCMGGAQFDGSGGSLEHDECIYTDGDAPGIVVKHDTLLNPNDQTAAIYVDNPDNGGGGVDGTVDIEDNLLAGGDYCIYGGDGTGGTVHTGPVTIENNRFSRLFFSSCGLYGTDAYMPPDTTWSGNVWDDTNKTVPE